MKKLKYFLLMSLLILGGCSSKSKEEVDISILCPSGAPALSLLEEYQNEHVTINTVSGSETLASEFVKNDSTYDIIIAPINLGCQLISKEQTTYRLAAVITWGNLYIIGQKDASLESTESFAAFGEGTVPQKIFTTVYDHFDPEVTYYNAVSDVMAQLVSGHITMGLVAEPIASVSINKAKENGIELQIMADLQEEYQKVTGSDTYGYPQAAIFVKEGCEDKVSSLLSRIEIFVNTTAIKEPEKIEELVTSIGEETLGVPNAKIAMNSWKRQNIHFDLAKDHEGDIKLLLEQFNITYQQNMLSH